MKITKAKLKQIIKEELSALSEAWMHSTDQDDWRGTSQEISTDVEGLPPEEQADPVVAAIAKVEDLRGLVEVGDEGALTAIDELWDHLQSMLTVPSNEVPLSRQ